MVMKKGVLCEPPPVYGRQFLLSICLNGRLCTEYNGAGKSKA